MDLSIVRLRRTMSLLELLVGLSACSVILTTSTVLLHRVMRVESAARTFANAERTAARFSHQFRQDVHQASAATVDPASLNSGPFLKLRLPNEESLEFSRVEGTIVRVQSQNGKVTARDEFAFPENSELSIEEQNSPKRLILSVTTIPPVSTSDADKKLRSMRSVPFSFQVEAVIDRNRLTLNPSAAEGLSK